VHRVRDRARLAVKREVSRSDCHRNTRYRTPRVPEVGAIERAGASSARLDCGIAFRSVVPEHLDRMYGGGNMRIRHCMAVAALLALGNSAHAVEYEAGNPVGHEGVAEIGVVSPVRYEGGVLVGHDGSVSLVVVNGVLYDDPAYTFDDTIGSTTARSPDSRGTSRRRHQGPLHDEASGLGRAAARISTAAR
jgi:hypothetical protein